MGMTHEVVQNKEKETRKKLMADLLAKHGLTEEDVKELTPKSTNAVSVLKHDGDIEQFVLWQKVDVGVKFKITIDFDFELDENPTPPPREVRRKNAKKKGTKKK